MLSMAITRRKHSPVTDDYCILLRLLVNIRPIAGAKPEKKTRTKTNDVVEVGNQSDREKTIELIELISTVRDEF